MINSRIIRIFLASSITELKNERDEIQKYLSGADCQNMFLQDNIIIQLVRSEDVYFGSDGENPQEILNQRLRECDISLFLFKTKAGERTQIEFEVAKSLQKENKHTMCVYCKKISEGKRSEELKRILKRLDKEGPDWSVFKNVGDLMATFIIGLLKFERNLLVKIGERYEQSPKSMQFWNSIEKIEKTGEEWYKQYAFHKKHENQCKEEVHKAVEGLIAHIESIMEDKSKPRADRIYCTENVYKKVVQWASDTDYDKKKYCKLLFDYAQFLYQYGMYFSAEKMFLRQIGISEELYGMENQNTATSYCTIGAVYWRLGDFTKAWNYHQKSLAIRKKVLGEDHPDTATSYNAIGLVFWKRGNYSNAMKYLNKALKIRKNLFGEYHQDTAESYSNIGMIYRRKNNFKKALEYHFIALKIRKQIFGLEHTETAESYNNIGAVYHYQQKYNEAIEYHKKALEIDLKKLGPTHPDTTIDYNNIGKNYGKLGEYQKALEYLKKAMEIDEMILGIDNPDTAVDYHNIGVLLYKNNQYEEALEFFEKALHIRTKKLVENHQDTLETQRLINLTRDAMNTIN